MGKGILLEMAGRQAVVLTPQGEFKKVPVPRGNWEIGDEIDYAEIRQQPVWLRWGTAAAAAAVLFVGFFAGYQQYALAQPVAVVTVDINPSLALTLNKADQVLKAVGLNADGELVLQGVDWKRKPFDTVVKAVTDRAVEEHKLNPADEGSAVLVGVAPAKEENLPEAQAVRVHDKALAAVTAEVAKVAKAQGQEPKTAVAVLVATSEEKKEAEKAGLSVGKYKFLPSLQEVAPQVTPEALKEAGPGKLLKELNINPSEIFSNAQKQNDEEHKDESGKQKGEKSQPAVTTPKQDQNQAPGNGKGPEGNPGGPKKDQGQAQPGDAKPDADKQGNSKSDEAKQGNAKPDDSKQGNGKADEAKPGNGKAGNAKNDATQANPDKNDAKANNGKQDEPKKDEPKKDEGKKDSWTIPWLNLTIEKPAFLRDKSQPTAETPRAEEPGVTAQPPADTAEPEKQDKPDKQDETKPAESAKPEQKKEDPSGKQNSQDSGKAKGNEKDKEKGKDK